MPKDSNKKDSRASASIGSNDTAASRGGSHQQEGASQATKSGKKRPRAGQSNLAGKKKQKKKKPKKKSKKPDSGYTLFFKSENAALSKSGEDIEAVHEREVRRGGELPPGFNRNKALVTVISHRWNNLDIMERLKWDTKAREEKEKAEAAAEKLDKEAPPTADDEESGAENGDGSDEMSDSIENTDDGRKSPSPPIARSQGGDSTAPPRSSKARRSSPSSASAATPTAAGARKLDQAKINLDPQLLEQILAIPLQTLEQVVSYKKRYMQPDQAAQPASAAASLHETSGAAHLQGSIAQATTTAAAPMHPTAQELALRLLASPPVAAAPAPVAILDMFTRGNSSSNVYATSHSASQMLPQPQPQAIVVQPATVTTRDPLVEELLARTQGTSINALSQPPRAAAGFSGGDNMTASVQNHLQQQLPPQQQQGGQQQQPQMEAWVELLARLARQGPPR